MTAPTEKCSPRKMVIFEVETAKTGVIREIFHLVHRQANLVVEIKHLSFQERAQAEKTDGNYK